MIRKFYKLKKIKIFLTFIAIKKIIAQIPKIVSPALICLIFFISSTIVVGRLLALKFIPVRFLNCATIISKAVDVEKAETTGIDMKSTRKPATWKF